MPIEPEVLEEMVLKIAAGKKERKRMTREHRRAWRRLKKQMLEIEGQGGHVDIPQLTD